MAKITLDKLNSLKNNFLDTVKEEKRKPYEKDPRLITVTTNDEGNGSLILRFIPDSDFRTVSKAFSHFGTIEANGETRRFIANCPTTIGQQCPYCEEYLAAWRVKDEATISLLKSGKRKETYLSNVLIINDPGNPENNGKVFLYKYSYLVNEMLKSAMKGDDTTGEPPIDVFHPVEGANFVLKYSKLGNKTSLQGSKFLRQSSIIKTEKDLNELLSKTINLTEYEKELEYLPYEELKRKFIWFYTGEKVTYSDKLKTETPTETSAETPAPKSTPKPKKAPKKQEVKIEDPEPDNATNVDSEVSDDFDEFFDSLN